MTVGEKIKEIRKEKGKTLEEIGNAIGVTRQTISRYESGEINIPYDKLNLIAKALNCSGADFFNYEYDTDRYDKEVALMLNNIKRDPMLRKFIHTYMNLPQDKQNLVEQIVYSYAGNQNSNLQQ